jgi:hypothetical protein
MSPENLSRRAILAGAVSVPALALPAVVAAAPATAPDIPVGRAAVVARAEQIVDLLRTRHVCEGWALDEGRAEQFQQNIRRLDIEAEDVDIEQQINDWVIDHGQSFDWIFRGDHGVMICGAAAGSTCAPNPDAELIALGSG